MPRYVILEHDHPFLHWDFMLETGEGLRTWRLAEPPQPNHEIKATALGIHRRLYLDYEGPLTGDRGCVLRWDAGNFTLLTEEDSSVLASLSGERLHGTATLRQVAHEEWSFQLLDS
jgi:hypothetical protein